jgi:hypothetical protein
VGNRSSIQVGVSLCLFINKDENTSKHARKCSGRRPVRPLRRRSACVSVSDSHSLSVDVVTAV